MTVARNADRDFGRMKKMYENQEVIDKEGRKLQEIDPNWRVGSITLDGNRAIAIGITIPIKGNAAKIRRLEADGWERTFRKKVRDDYRAFQVSGNIPGTVLQRMRKDIREE